MASEITPTGSLTYADSQGASESLSLPAVSFSIGTKLYHKGQQSILTSETVLNVGGIADPGYVLIINRDPTNYVSLRNATGAINSQRLDPAGGFAFMKWDAVTAPCAIANTATCVVEIFLLST